LGVDGDDAPIFFPMVIELSSISVIRPPGSCVSLDYALPAFARARAARSLPGGVMAAQRRQAAIPPDHARVFDADRCQRL
jgi:hypothetical protein